MNTSATYDVFLSYSSLDRQTVMAVAEELKKRKCICFVDQWYLKPGLDWVAALEKALNASRSVAVFLGPHEMGRWQQRERAWALDYLTEHDEFPVIPVLLPSCEPPLGFMRQLMWIDLRDDPTSATQLDALAAAIRGDRAELDARPEPRAMICPYRGLRAFREEDADFFFGRDDYLKQLVSLVQRETLVAVVGASGSGKSSLVSAGLVPQLRTHRDGPVWDVVRMVPQVDPLYSLAEALVPLIEPELSGLAFEQKLGEVANDLEREKPKTPLWGLANAVLRQQPGTSRLLLFVDQWEELYTNCEQAERRERFIAELLAATSRKDSPLTVVLTVRADFYSRFLEHRPLLDRIQAGRLDLGPMSTDELRAVIEGPAKNTGLSFEHGLVDRILKEAGEEPGRLPLLEFALEELWQRRDGVQMTHAGYDDLGRPPGQKSAELQAGKGDCLSQAIATYAEGVYSGLEDKEQDALPGLFRRLVRAGAKTEEDTRRRADFRSLDDLSQRVVRKLADRRLLVTTRGAAFDPGAPGGETADAPTTGEMPAAPKATPHDDAASETVEVAHEELLRRWGRLKQWIDKDRKFLQWRGRLAPRIERFQDDPQTALLRLGDLQEARQFYPSRRTELEDKERSFVDASLKAERRRKIQMWTGVIATALVACGIVIAVGLILRQQKNRATVAAAVDNLPSTPAIDVPKVLGKLKLSPDYAAELLKNEYDNEENPRYKLRLAYGRIAAGDVEHADHEVVTFVVSRIPNSRSTESANLTEALSRMDDRKAIVNKLFNAAGEATDDSVRCRYLATAFSLGEVGRIKTQLELDNSPQDRTAFIHGFAAWPGDLKRIAELLRENHEPDLRSGLCAALGRVDVNSRSADERQAIAEVITWLYREAPDGGTHGAADWTLRQWQMDLPTMETCRSEAQRKKWLANRDWYVNSAGMTMLKVPKGDFRMGSEEGDEYAADDEKAHDVTISEFWLSDREVNFGQFREFRSELETETEQTDSPETPNLALPADDVTWFDAVEFCNKLSHAEDVDEYYELANTVRDDERRIESADVTTMGTNGYRLPTEAEWEYACRAGSPAQFCYGDEADIYRPALLSAYAVIAANVPDVCGSKMPNGWGLFDMHGNLWEWCQDWYDEDYYGQSPDTDPQGPLTGAVRGAVRVYRGAYRVYRGGCWATRAEDCRSANRNRGVPVYRSHFLGFRVARSPSGK